MHISVPIIIPSLEPDERLPALVAELKKSELSPIVIVDDGSGEGYRAVFDELEGQGCTVLRHEVNRGKGRALKTAFAYLIDAYPDMIGCVTADSDGQHSPECIAKCKDALQKHTNSLVLGVRDFSGEDVPTKSRYGNNLTKWICKHLCGVNVSDTQTGLRAIPTEFMKELLELEGERFEFETRMLLAAKGKFPIFEVPIKTIYDSKENHTTHFNPVKDSIRIYKIFFGEIGKFLLSSLSSCVIDLVLFWLFTLVFAELSIYYAAIATVLARVISATYNYLVNYILVFRSNASHKKSTLRYVLLAIVQMSLSAAAVTCLTFILPMIPDLAVKIPVDTVLFFASYLIQKKFVYSK